MIYVPPGEKNSMRKMFVPILLTVFLHPLLSANEFTVEEVNKIRQVLHQMITILEGNQQEILEIEEVLSRTGTQLRKARAKETLERKLKSFRLRIKDIKTIRNGFISSRQLKEYIIGIDDKIRLMEQNLTMIEDIYFPQILANEKVADYQDEYPTFINPGDPRFELDDEEMRLSRAIRNTRNLMNLRNSQTPVNDHFSEFITEFDQNLKAENKPERHEVPVMGGLHSLDEFHGQLEEARRRDRNFDWNENRNHREFREFFQNVEQLDQEATINRRIVTGFPEVDDGSGAQSQKAFFELMENVQLKARQEEDKKVISKSLGEQEKLKGFAGFMNDIRVDGHKVSKKEFSDFINELEPIRSEVTMSYQKGIIKKNIEPEVILRRETVAWHETDQSFLQRLRHQRLFEQADNFYEGEVLMADRIRVKTKTKPFSLPQNFREFEQEAEEYLEHHERVQAHDYRDVAGSNHGFFVQENAPAARETINPIAEQTIKALPIMPATPQTPAVKPQQVAVKPQQTPVKSVAATPSAKPTTAKPTPSAAPTSTRPAPAKPAASAAPTKTAAKPQAAPPADNRILPVTVQLLDETQAPFVNNLVEFRLEFSPQAKAANLQARFMEATYNKAVAKVKTDQKGEARVNLLIDLQDHEIKIERDVEYNESKVRCIVKLDLES